MHRRIVPAVVGLVLAGVVCAGAQTTSPGKNSVFVAGGFNAATSAAPILSGQILKGKKTTVLAIEAALFYLSGARSYSMFPLVNGIITTNAPAMSFNCTGSDPCAFTGTWWLDIDAAEAAHPGLFVGQPLNIELRGEEDTGAGDTGDFATLTVRVQKK